MLLSFFNFFKKKRPSNKKEKGDKVPVIEPKETRANKKDDEKVQVVEPKETHARKSHPQPTEPAAPPDPAPLRQLTIRFPINLDEAERAAPPALYGLRFRAGLGPESRLRFTRSGEELEILLVRPLSEGGTRTFRFDPRTGDVDEFFPAPEE